MKIGFICSEYPPGPHGGIGTMTQVLSRVLVQGGHQVSVAGIYDNAYPAPDVQDDQGVKVWRLRKSGSRMGWIPARYRLFQLVSKWVREKSVDVIEVPDYQGLAAGWGPLAAPVVARLHGSETYFAQELGVRVRRGSFLIERASCAVSIFGRRFAGIPRTRRATCSGCVSSPAPFYTTRSRCPARRTSWYVERTK